jgi:hypothetical protein
MAGPLGGIELSARDAEAFHMDEGLRTALNVIFAALAAHDEVSLQVDVEHAISVLVEALAFSIVGSQESATLLADTVPTALPPV